ncbi:hypothetical protein [Primorskyibacter sp. 2E233]|uniref:hypothetical protein n=1 Tax=Primorskyibacter sp. 2E233 TaxID=3413431 RepID=UPI003BEF7034
MTFSKHAMAIAFSTSVALLTATPSLVAAAPAGSCDSTTGCHALKRACLKIEGTYTGTNDKGVCNKKSTAAISGGLSASGSTTTTKPAANAPNALAAALGADEDAKCVDKALCKELRTACQGTWEWINPPNHGICRD